MTRLRVRLLLAVVLCVIAGRAGAEDRRPFLLRAASRAEAEALVQRYRLRLEREVRAGELYRVRHDDARTETEVETELRGDVRVQGVELDRALELPEVPPDVSLQQSTAAILEALPQRTVVPFYGQQVWNRFVDQPAARMVHVPEVRALSTGAGTIVAVIDTGIDPTHPVLKDVLVSGYDFTRDVAGVPSELADLDQSTAAILEQSTAAILERDRVISLNQSTAAILEGDRATRLAGRTFPRAFGHGTMVAGLVRLVAPDARIMPLKAFTGEGASSLGDLVRAVYYAADHGAQVINLSFSMSVESPELKRALAYAKQRGVVAVASAGNNGRKVVLYPAAWSETMGVGSTGDRDQRSVFSNYGSSVRLAAPGEGVVTTFPAGLFAAAWGTSFSTAIVSGAAALGMSGLPATATPAQRDAREELVREGLRRAIPIGQDLGAGRLDLVLALQYIKAYEQSGATSSPADDDDEDEMPNEYEVRYGLDPTSDDDGDDDPDRDGRTNRQEFEDGTHPRGLHTSYLAEGAVNGFFDVRLALFNPASQTAQVLLRFQRADGSQVTRPVTLPARRRATLTVRDVPELLNAEFATVIESDVRVVVDRTMSWDDHAHGSHAEHAVDTPPGLTWYLAEGATTGSFNLFYLLQNPGTLRAEVEITYLRPAPQTPVVQRVAVEPRSRLTVWVNQVPGLERAEMSGIVRSVNGVPILAERAMYAAVGGQAYAAGHGGAAIAQPETEWLLAEGATGRYFDTFVLVANPHTSPADVEATYLRPDGRTVVKQYRVGARSRLTIWVDQEDPLLADTAVSTRLRVLNAVPVIVERAMWWPDGGWQEAHVSVGATTTGHSWALADGEEGGAARTQTYVLIANPTDVAGQARVTLVFEDGTQLLRQFDVLANSRLNVAIGAEFPAAAGRRFAVHVESVGTTPVPLVVERSMYGDGPGATWTSGTSALATRLQ